MRRIPKVILWVETSRSYGRRLLHGVARYAHLHGPWAFYSEPSGQEQALPRLDTWGADGIIVRESVKNVQTVPKGTPAIYLTTTSTVPGKPNIVVDAEAVGQMAAEHFLERGFRHFAFCGVGYQQFLVERGHAFGETVKQAGYDTHVYEPPRARRDRLWQNEQSFLADWLQNLPKPVGVMALNDDRGRHVIEACKLAEIHVPEEVAIVGVDDDSLVCDLSDPPLSSVALNAERAGYEAAELLARMMNGETVGDARIYVRATHVVVRQSSDIFAIEDPDVAQAVRYIARHAREPITVDEVAEAAVVSRRGLERRFRRYLGRTIHEEIKRVRIDLTARMLVNTNLSVARIANELGWADYKHIAREFRQAMGMSPLKYRQRYGK